MAHYYLTRRAFMDLEDIYYFSIQQWGKRVAQTYIEELYSSFEIIANNPEKGKQHSHRSFPFYMAPVGKHFAVYEPIASYIIIAAVIHSKRDIDKLINILEPELVNEIYFIKKQLIENFEKD